MVKAKLLIVSVLLMLLSGTFTGYAQKETQGYWLNILSYDHSNVSSNIKVFNGGIITPGKWIGLGLSIGDLYSTSARYQVFNENEGTLANYGMLSLVTPSIHFIPIAKQSSHPAFDGRSMNLLHLYISYSPWSAVSLSNKVSEDIPMNILGRSRVFDIGVAYTFSFISFLPVSIKAGYINMFNHQGDIYAYHFPANKFDYFYYGMNISLGAWNTGGLHVKDRYTVAPFIVNSGRALRYRSKMNREWNAVRTEGSIEACEKFIRAYPHEDLSRQARSFLERLREQKDWEAAESAGTLFGL